MKIFRFAVPSRYRYKYQTKPNQKKNYQKLVRFDNQNLATSNCIKIGTHTMCRTLSIDLLFFFFFNNFMRKLFNRTHSYLIIWFDGKSGFRTAHTSHSYVQNTKYYLIFKWSIIEADILFTLFATPTHSHTIILCPSICCWLLAVAASIFIGFHSHTIMAY